MDTKIPSPEVLLFKGRLLCLSVFLEARELVSEAVWDEAVSIQFDCISGFNPNVVFYCKVGF